ncbi:MAG: DUF1016 N-terminal domain-containing protein [Rhodanobacter sp.]|jgi:hypothetical protein|nr:DUF1016 N-terminal domain-containing protein [Rhodanobacter sp.]
MARQSKQLALPAKPLLEDIRDILRNARQQTWATVNTLMVQAYWHIGRRIVQEEQQGKERADYGAALIRTHADIGQMDMYVRLFDDLKRNPDDNPTLGIIAPTRMKRWYVTRCYKKAGSFSPPSTASSCPVNRNCSRNWSGGTCSIGSMWQRHSRPRIRYGSRHPGIPPSTIGLPCASAKKTPR